jgi:hypothetical protein
MCTRRLVADLLQDVLVLEPLDLRTRNPGPKYSQAPVSLNALNYRRLRYFEVKNIAASALAAGAYVFRKILSIYASSVQYVRPNNKNKDVKACLHVTPVCVELKSTLANTTACTFLFAKYYLFSYPSATRKNPRQQCRSLSTYSSMLK